MRDSGLAKALAMATQLGFAIACPMVAFIAGGAWLDGRLGTTPLLLLVGVLLGVLAAGGALFQLTTSWSRKDSARRAGRAPYKVERGGTLGTTPAERAEPEDSENR